MTTVANEGNRRQGQATNEELLQSVVDIKSWFAHHSSLKDINGVKSSDFERFEKITGTRLPSELRTILLEMNGKIWIMDKPLLSLEEIIDIMTKYENNSKWNSNSYIPFAGDENCLFILVNNSNIKSFSSSSSSENKDSNNNSSDNNNNHLSIYEWTDSEGINDEPESQSLGNFMETYRDALLNGHCEYVEDVGVIETVSKKVKPTAASTGGRK